MKTIKTEQYYLVTEGSKTQQPELLYLHHDDEIPYAMRGHQGDLIGHLPIGSSPELEGVPLLMNKEGDNFELDEEAKKYADAKLPYWKGISDEEIPQSDIDEWNGFFYGYYDGYRAAQQKGCFTLEQMNKAITLARKCNSDQGVIDIDAIHPRGLRN